MWSWYFQTTPGRWDWEQNNFELTENDLFEIVEDSTIVSSVV